MKKLILAVMFIVLMLGAAAISHAQEGDWHGGIRARVHSEYDRIERGVEQGSLTRHEAGMLKGELDGIIEKIDRMKRDGHLDQRERDVINRNLDRLHRDISREKRDDDRRPDFEDRRPIFEERRPNYEDHRRY
jgi:hypothetical protein